MGGETEKQPPKAPTRTPLQQLAADVHELAQNVMVPVTIRNTLRLAVQLLADQEQRIKALESRHV